MPKLLCFQFVVLHHKFKIYMSSFLSANFLKNSFWQIIQRSLWVVQALTIGILVTRKLGPELWGEFNYAFALCALLGWPALIQCDGVLVRAIVRHPDVEKIYLGTDFVLRVSAAALGLLFTVIGAALFPMSLVVRKVLILLGISSFIGMFTAPVVVNFNAHCEQKYEAWGQICTCLIYCAARLLATYFNSDLIGYAWCEFSISLGCVFFHYFIYWLHGRQLTNWYFCSRRFAVMLRCSIPIFGMTVTWMAYSRIDLLMLHCLSDFSNEGYYALAQKLGENLTILVTLIIGVVSPMLFSVEKKSILDFRKFLGRFYMLIFWLTVLLAIFIAFIADPAVRLLYGAAFYPAVGVLRIFVFTSLFFGINGVFNQWAIKSNLLYWGTLVNVSGLVINVVLNLWLIPYYGAAGAAWSSVISAPIGLILVLSMTVRGRYELSFIFRSIISCFSLSKR